MYTLPGGLTQAVLLLEAGGVVVAIGGAPAKETRVIGGGRGYLWYLTPGPSGRPRRLIPK